MGVGGSGGWGIWGCGCVGWAGGQGCGLVLVGRGVRIYRERVGVRRGVETCGGGGKGCRSCEGWVDGLARWMSEWVWGVWSAGIGLGPCDWRFRTLNCKIAHYFNRECTIFTSIIQYLVNTWKLRTELVKITHKTVQN